MKKIQYAPAVERSMSFVDPDGVQRVQAWFDYLTRWDEDEAVRKNSLPLPGHPGVYMLKTTTDIRVFFRIDGDTVTVLDVASREAIIKFEGVRVAGSADAALTPREPQGN